jgi:hypothetical protein
VQPVVPFVKFDEFAFDSIRAVLIEDFVDGSREPFRVGVREFLVVVQENSGVLVVLMQRFEVFRVVREKDDGLVGAPLE